MKPFLKRLGVGLGILSGVLLLLTGVGMIAEPLALAATIIAVASAALLIIGGKVWLWIIAFQESFVQGLLVLLIPYYWIVYMVTRKGRALRAMALVFSAAVPALFAMVMLLFFASRYENVARSVNQGNSRPRSISSSQIREMETRIRQAHERSGEKDVLRTVSFRSFSQVRGPVDPAKAERALADQPGYVAGSFRFDANQRTVMFQYRGDQSMAKLYAFLLPAKADLMIALTPTFVEETELPETSILSTRPAATTATTLGPASASIAESVATPSPPLQTVSFQTFGQSSVDAAQAEAVLSEMPDYVADSFRFDPGRQTITFQYRGQQAAAMQYAFALQGKMHVTLRLKPVFAQEAVQDD
jgi:hypothetical protein